MGYTYTIDEASELATVVWTGVVQPEDAGEAIREVARDPRCKPTYRRLVDMRAARVQIPKQDNRELAQANADTARGHGAQVQRGKTAIVVGDELSFGIASQYAAYAELQGVPTEVFRDIAAAYTWLELQKRTDAAVSVK